MRRHLASVAVNTHIALGATGYTVPINAATGRSSATALQSEKDRAEIQDVQNVSEFQKDISFIVEPSEEYYIREIGFLLICVSQRFH